MAGGEEDVEGFLSKVDKVDSLIRGMNAGEDGAMAAADEFVPDVSF